MNTVEASTIHTIQPPGLPYPIVVGIGALAGVGRRLRVAAPADRSVVVTDETVGLLYGDVLERALKDAGFDSLVITVPPGDASKSLSQAGLLYDDLAERGHGRDEPIIALGGGVVGDLAGFVAATWHRGVPFVQCPTTLEADIDASIGGKTAINHEAGKNLIGAFHRPVLVCIDVACLRTLSVRDYAAALAESVKHAIIRDAAFFEWHEQNAEAIVRRDGAVLDELIVRNCRHKAEVVVTDERETASDGVGRAALNFGHTLGHAIEAHFRYRLRHGEAVALGMVAALDLAVRRCGLPASDRDRAEALLSRLGLRLRLPEAVEPEHILRRLVSDKKVRSQTVRMILPTRIGDVRWFESPADADLLDALGRIAPS
ncbi:MAG: 3-dehydroquinate synthase [Phycisphaerae bacterium]